MPVSIASIFGNVSAAVFQQLVNWLYPPTAPFAQPNGLRLKWLTTTAVALLGGQAQSAASQNVIVTPGVNINLAVNGAGGLDLGVLAAAKSYAVWLLQGASGTTAVASLSFNYAGVTVPAGYTAEYRCVGSFVSDPAVARVNEFRQSGDGATRRIHGPWSGNQKAINVGHSLVSAPVDCSPFVPPTATMVKCNIQGAPNAAPGATNIIMWAPSGYNLGAYQYTDYITIPDGPAFDAQSSLDWVPLDAAKQFVYRCVQYVGASVPNATISVVGYEEEL